MSRLSAAAILAGCLLLGTVHAETVTAEDAEAAASREGSWAVIAGSHVFYTDDASVFSAARRQQFSEDPSQPTGVPPKKLQDFVWDPSLELIRSVRSSLGQTDLSFKGHGFIFTNNPVFNHGNYRAQILQRVSPATALLLRYRYVPNLFLGPNVERRTGNQLIEDERVTSHIWRAELERRLGDRWWLTLVSRYGLRLYNEAFAQRDTTFWTLGPEARWQPAPWLATTVAYLYERGLADGRGDTRFNDDISYRQHAVSFGNEVAVWKAVSLHLLYIYRLKDFTSDLAADAHFGRRDTTHQGSVELRYHITPFSTLTAGFQRTHLDSTNDLQSFQDTIVSVGAEHRF